MTVDITDNMHPRYYDDDGHEIRMIDYYRIIKQLKEEHHEPNVTYIRKGRPFT